MNTTTSPTGAPRYANRGMILLTVCIVQFLVTMEWLIVSIALPAIEKDLELAPTDLAWVTNIYGLFFGGFLLFGGRASDLFGRRRMLISGTVGFALASLLCALAPNAEILLTARALQGLSAAFMAPAALGILLVTHPDQADRNRALALYGATAPAGGSTGLVLGGFLTDTLSWNWIFYINIPVALLIGALALRNLPAGAGQKSEGFDVFGALTVTGGMLALVYTAVSGQEQGWGSLPTLLSAALAAVLIAAFVWVEKSHPAPLVRLELFRNRNLVAGIVILFLMFGVSMTITFITTLYLQTVLGWTAFHSGLAFVPASAAVFAGTQVAKKLIPAIGPRNVFFAAAALVVVGAALYTRISADGNYALEVLPTLILLFLGMGMSFVSVNIISTMGMAPRESGLAAGLISTAQQVGGALWLAILATLAAVRAATAIDQGVLAGEATVDGFRAAIVLCAILAVAAALVATRIQLPARPLAPARP